MNATSLPPNAPMTNGTRTTGHGEADVSSTGISKSNNDSSSLSPSSLQDICALLHAQVNAFLTSPPPDEVTKRTQAQTKIALEVIVKALQDYKYGTLSISYNGGKDCLVLLIMYLAVLHTHFTQPTNRRKGNLDREPEPEPEPETKTEQDTQTETQTQTTSRHSSSIPTSIPAIYAKPPDPFPAVTEFVEYSSKLYHLDLTHISTNPGPRPREHSHSNPPLTHPFPFPFPPPLKEIDNGIDSSINITNIDSNVTTTTTTTTTNETTTTTSKPIISFRDAFALYLAAHPSVKAIFVGTRRTDPHGSHLTHFDPTDHNWPAFMRVHPIIDWHLSEIWCFLRSPHLRDPISGGPLRYCPMYDEGYTSLGGINDTLKNPKLKYMDENGVERYRPAYEMTEDEGERLGRE
ncbi:hypothetical protein A1O1_02722 [Capronia coronata CBS 617.96]|uniref:FAD synthase n=1 Tax=Capronia coronata CBS 617.96 TaxID=1182541 RepID=W9YP72_9EURO|nr:uncharacterized protein A1O1_02722 [Capronia coronata CBS 617.96]EXJ94328.1 hypothetical protein A1O1_02722 [Capronia coronata CBS 617.96]